MTTYLLENHKVVQTQDIQFIDVSTQRELQNIFLLGKRQ